RRQAHARLYWGRRHGVPLELERARNDSNHGEELLRGHGLPNHGRTHGSGHWICGVGRCDQRSIHGHLSGLGRSLCDVFSGVAGWEGRITFRLVASPGVAHALDLSAVVLRHAELGRGDLAGRWHSLAGDVLSVGSLAAPGNSVRWCAGYLRSRTGRTGQTFAVLVQRFVGPPSSSLDLRLPEP